MKFMKYIWTALLVVALSIVFSVGIFCYVAHSLLGDVGQSVKFLRTKNMLERYYYGEIDSHKLLEGAIRGMVDAVDDPYTNYLDKKDVGNESPTILQVSASMYAAIAYILNHPYSGVLFAEEPDTSEMMDCAKKYLIDFTETVKEKRG